MRQLSVALVVFCLSVVWNNERLSAFPIPPVQDSVTSKIKNGTFADWDDKLPVDWTVKVGANNGGDTPKSKIKQGPGPSLELSGNVRTKAWLSVSQTIEVKPGQAVELSYSAKAVGIKREGRQFNNCYVAVFPKTTDGTKASPQVWPVNSKKYKDETHTWQAPDNVAQFDLVIFLSKTGKLNVKNFKIGSSTLKPEDSFDVLVKDMAKHYSFFEHKKIDWKKHSNRYRDHAIKAKSPEEFAQAVSEMLDELKDTHIWVKFNGKQYGSYSSRTTGKHDFQFVKNDLTETNRFGKFGIIGMTKDGFCYVNFTTLSNIPDDGLETMMSEASKRFDAPGFIIDLRENGGGSEPVAQKFAGMFIDKEVVYAKNTRRNGDAPADFSEPTERVLRPTSQQKSFNGPVVCLIGPNAVSSAEGFAMLMKAVPTCTVVGQPTRGASGNPEAIELPNGVVVWYSRWKSLMPDGTCIEDVGVQPDVKVEAKAGSDAAYEKALEILKKKSKSE